MTDWCICEGRGTCIGCLTDLLILQAFGTDGYGYLRKHTGREPVVISGEEYKRLTQARRDLRSLLDMPVEGREA